MILDTIENAARYYPAVPGLESAITAIRARLDAPYRTGRVDVDGDRIYLLCNEYEPGSLNADSRMEAHRAYLDVMYMFSGSEYIWVSPTERLTNVMRPYDAAIEALLAMPEADATRVLLKKGQFIVLFPQDAHCPALSTPEGGSVQKIIAKVAVV